MWHTQWQKRKCLVTPLPDLHGTWNSHKKRPTALIMWLSCNRGKIASFSAWHWSFGCCLLLILTCLLWLCWCCLLVGGEGNGRGWIGSLTPVPLLLLCGTVVLLLSVAREALPWLPWLLPWSLVQQLFIHLRFYKYNNHFKIFNFWMKLTRTNRFQLGEAKSHDIMSWDNEMRLNLHVHQETNNT